MEAACQRLCEGDASSLVDIVNFIDVVKTSEPQRLGTRAVTAIINVLIHEGVELRRSHNRESVLPSPTAFFAMRALGQLGTRKGDDGVEVQRALLVLGLQRCRDLCLDAYFALGRAQRYYVVLFVKLLIVLYGCTPHDLLRSETSINTLTGSMESERDSPAPERGGESPARVSPQRSGRHAHHHSGGGDSSRGSASRSAPRSAPSPPPPRDGAANASPSPNIQNRSALLVSIPGVSFDMPLRPTRRFRELPKKPINVPFPVNPLYEGPPISSGDGTTSPPPTSPEPATLLPSTTDPEIAIPAQFPTPVMLFSAYFGVGCVPHLPTTDDLARLDAWRQEKQQSPPPPRDYQKAIIKTGKGTAESGEVGRGVGKTRLVALRFNPATSAPNVEAQNFQVRNERIFVSTDDATARYQRQCLDSPLLQQYVDHGKLLGWGSSAKGALGPLRQRRQQSSSSPSSQRPAALTTSSTSLASPAARSGSATSSRKHSDSTTTLSFSAATAAKDVPALTSRTSGGTPKPSHGGSSSHGHGRHHHAHRDSPQKGTSAQHQQVSEGDGAAPALVPLRSGQQATAASKQARASDCVYLPLPVHTTVRVAAIACGLSVSYLVTLDGQLFSCGRGEHGQLGIGERSLRYDESGTSRLQRVLLKDDERVTRVAAGTACVVALAGDRALYCWGHNVYGQCLKMADQSRVLSPVRLKTSKYKVLDICFGQFFGVLLFDDGMMGTWGIASMLGCAVNEKGLEESLAPDQCKCARQVVHLELGSACAMAAVRAGPWHALAISRQGEVYTWGVGRDGRLGHGTDTSEVKPRLVEALQSCFVVDASCASSHTAVLTSTGSVYVFGENAEGQLGQRGRSPRRLPVMLPLPGKAVAIACAREHTCVLLEDGDVVACGSYRTCGIGLGHGTRLCAPVRILTDYVTLALQSGHFHSLAGVLHRRTALMMVGHSTIEEVSRISSVVVRNGVRCAASGVGFLVVLSENSSLVAIGRGERGQLGVGDFMKPINKDDVTVTQKFTPVLLPDGVVIQHVRCGPDYVVAIDQSGAVYGWGSNEHQKLGCPASVDYVYTPVRLVGYGEEQITQVACGGSFLLALTAEGEVLANGEAAYCGLGAKPSSSPRKNAPTLTAGCIGAPARIAALHDIVAIAAGRRHAIAMTSSCNIFAWGVGVLGNAGDATRGLSFTTVASTPVRVALSQNIRTIGCGPFNSFAITEEGTLWVWGVNRYGECGVTRSGAAAPAEASPPPDGVAAAVLETPLAVAHQVRDAAFTAQFGLVVFEDGQVRVSGRVRQGGRKFVLPSFHSNPQPTFSIDVNEPLRQRRRSEESLTSTGQTGGEANGAASSAGANPPQESARALDNNAVISLGEDADESSDDDDDGSSSRSSSSVTSSTSGGGRLRRLGAWRGGTVLPAKRATSATPTEARHALPAQPLAEFASCTLPSNSRDSPHCASRPDSGEAAVSTGNLVSRPAAPGAPKPSSPRLPPVRPTSGHLRALTSVGSAASGTAAPALTTRVAGVAAVKHGAAKPASPPRQLSEQQQQQDTLEAELLRQQSSLPSEPSVPDAALAVDGGAYLFSDAPRSPDVSVNHGRNFPEEDDGSPMQLPIPGEAKASVEGPAGRKSTAPPLQSPVTSPSMPRPPQTPPPPANASRPAAATTTTATGSSTTGAPSQKKDGKERRESPAAPTSLSSKSTPLAASAAAQGTQTPAAAENRIFGVRCFAGWEQICTVMEKHRPSAKEARMAQVGLQVMLHQPREISDSQTLERL